MTFHVIIVKYKESQKIETWKNFLRGGVPLSVFSSKKISYCLGLNGIFPGLLGQDLSVQDLFSDMRWHFEP